MAQGWDQTIHIGTVGLQVKLLLLLLLSLCCCSCMHCCGAECPRQRPQTKASELEAGQCGEGCQ